MNNKYSISKELLLLLKSFSIKQIIALIFIAFIVIPLFIVYVHMPIVNEIMTARNEADVIAQSIESAQNFLHDHPEGIDVFLSKLKVRNSLAVAALPNEFDNAAFLLLISDASQRNNVDLEKFQPEPPRYNKELGLNEQVVNITIAGDYFDILDFLYSLRDKLRFVKSYSVKAMPTSGYSAPRITCTLAISIWYFPAKKNR